MESGLLSMAQEFSGLPMDALIGGPLNAAAKANAAMALTQTKFMLDTCFVKTTVPATPAVAGVPASAPGVTPVVEAVIATPAIPAHDNYTPIMIVMSLTRAVLTPGSPGVAGDPSAVPPTQSIPATAPIITNFTTTFNLPLLTIVPLNSLAVDTVDITFEMEVKSSYSEEQTQSQEKQMQGQSSFEAKAGWGPVSVTIKGSASYDQKDSSTHNTHYQKSNSAKYTVNVHAGQLPLPKGVNVIIDAFANAIQPITLK